MFSEINYRLGDYTCFHAIAEIYNGDLNISKIVRIHLISWLSVRNDISYYKKRASDL